jgi:hypothetical protein
MLETRARLVERTPAAAKLAFAWGLIARAPTRVNRARSTSITISATIST